MYTDSFNSVTRLHLCKNSTCPSNVNNIPNIFYLQIHIMRYFCTILLCDECDKTIVYNFTILLQTHTKVYTSGCLKNRQMCVCVRAPAPDSKQLLRAQQNCKPTFPSTNYFRNR